MEVAGILIDESESFLEDFLTEYLKGGFGRMNKTDLEYLLFHLFVKHKCFKSKSNFEISLLLKLPESRVRRLQYEAELRYGIHDKSDEVLLKRLIECKSDYLKDNVRFSFEDKFVQTLFISELKKTASSLSDLTSNPEIVSVSKTAFVNFLVLKYCQSAEDPFFDEYNDESFPKEEDESGIHYCVRLLIEKAKPIPAILKAVSSVFYAESEPRELLNLL